MENENILVQVAQKSKNEKLIITAQNVLLKQYFEEMFEIPVYDISRDKENHPIFLSVKNKENIHAYTLAIHDQTKMITPFQVGKIEFDNNIFSDVDTYIEVVGIHDAFAGKGIGTIILQGAENYFTELNRRAIELQSLRTFVDLSKNNMSYQQIVCTMAPYQAEQYIKNNFYDKNLYFYSSMGYVKVSRGDKYGVQMRKNKLKNVPITYGFERPMTLLKAKNAFKISSEFTGYIDQLRTGQKKDFFNKKSTNIFQSEKISPIQIKPTIEDTKNLDLIFSRFETYNGIYLDQIPVCFENNKKHNNTNSNLSKLANNTKNDTKIISTIHNHAHQTFEKCMKALNQFIEPEIEHE